MNLSEKTLTETSIVEDPSRMVLSGQAEPMWIESGTQRGTLATYLEIPFMHKRLILACTLLGILLGWLAIVVSPRSYESEAKLMIRVGRESVALDPTATTSTTMSVQKTHEGEIMSALEVLNSRQVAERVVDQLGPSAILRGELTRDATTNQPAANQVAAASSLTDTLAAWKQTTSSSLRGLLSSAGVSDDISDRESAVRRIQSSVSIRSPVKSTVISINARSKSPEMAQAIAAAVTEFFMDEHLQAALTDGSLAFFQHQTANVEVELNQLQAERSKFMQEHGIVSLDASRELMKDRLSGIDRDLVEASGQLQQSIAAVDNLKSKIAVADEEIVAEKLFGVDSTWSGMRQQVYLLELQEQSLAAHYTDQNPKLKHIREQLSGARSILAELESERVDKNTTPNPLKIKLKEGLQKEQTRVVAFESMIKETSKLRDNLGSQVDQMLEHERQLTQVDRNIASLEASFLALREKEEEARVIDQLHVNKISNVHVFQPATFVERPVSPQKKILGSGFLFLGLMIGLTLSFLREGSSQTLRTAADVESQLGVPVVSTIPKLKQMSAGRMNVKRTYRKTCQELMAEILISQQRSGRKRGRSLGIIGVDVGAGASTLAANLAVTSDRDCHRKTVLVDADLRNRSLSRMFGLNGSPGLIELLSGSASHDECLQSVANAGIAMIASAADSSDETLTSGAAEIVQALEAYLTDCDLLIVDLPAASQPDQTVALAQCLDSILVVVQSEKTKTLAADRLINRLSKGHAEIVGVVLTRTRCYLPKFIRGFVG